MGDNKLGQLLALDASPRPLALLHLPPRGMSADHHPAGGSSSLRRQRSSVEVDFFSNDKHKEGAPPGLAINKEDLTINVRPVRSSIELLSPSIYLSIYLSPCLGLLSQLSIKLALGLLLVPLIVISIAKSLLACMRGAPPSSLQPRLGTAA